MLSSWPFGGYFFSYSNITENLNAKKIIGASGLILFLSPIFISSFVKKYYRDLDRKQFYLRLREKFTYVNSIEVPHSIYLEKTKAEAKNVRRINLFGFYIDEYKCSIIKADKEILTWNRHGAIYNKIGSFIEYRYHIINDKDKVLTSKILTDIELQKRLSDLQRIVPVEVLIENGDLVFRKSVVQNGYCDLDIISDIENIELFYRKIYEPLMELDFSRYEERFSYEEKEDTFKKRKPIKNFLAFVSLIFSILGLLLAVLTFFLGSLRSTVIAILFVSITLFVTFQFLNRIDYRFHRWFILLDLTVIIIFISHFMTSKIFFDMDIEDLDSKIVANAKNKCSDYCTIDEDLYNHDYRVRDKMGNVVYKTGFSFMTFFIRKGYVQSNGENVRYLYETTEGPNREVKCIYHDVNGIIEIENRTCNFTDWE